MDTASLERYFETVIAPTRLAETWDNVGLLVHDGGTEPHQRVGLTIELTEATFDEALSLGVTFLFVYHPPIFSGLKRLTHASHASKIVVRALKSGLALYSSHTALDAAEGGMAEWLAEALGPGTQRPIVPASKDPDERAGAGRLVTLHEPVSLPQALELIKGHLGLTQLRLAESAAAGEKIRSLAVCPGAGGSLFEKVGSVDLLLTGEMRHHDVVARVRQGSHVILTEHTNSERGYLPLLASRMRRDNPTLEVLVLASDRDPLRTI